jgi:DHA1 family tetracycline resistance protein-like MFS transporter
MGKTAPTFFILMTLAIGAIGIGIVFPIMPDLMERIGRVRLSEGALWGGILMASLRGCCSSSRQLSEVFPTLTGANLSCFWPWLCWLDYVIMALAGVYWVYC